MMTEPLPRVVQLGTSRREFWLLLAGTLVLDLLTKALTFHWLAERPDGVWLVPESAGFLLAQNPGAAFSILGSVTGGRFILIIIGVALLGMLVRMARQTAFARVWWAIALVSGGAIANLFDRIWYGHVRDFIKVGWWPTFNVADIGITVGVVVLLIHLVRPDTPHEPATEHHAG